MRFCRFDKNRLGIVAVDSVADIKEIPAIHSGVSCSMHGAEDSGLREPIASYGFVGPWPITAEEIPNPGDERCCLGENERRRQDLSTRYMVFGTRKLISSVWGFHALMPEVGTLRLEAGAAL